MSSQPANTRKRRISREQILTTAIAIVDRAGLDACNMRRIAKELGVEAMSLYNHVANKDDLLDGMAELLLRGVPVAATPAERWQDDLRQIALAYRAMLYAHPALLPVLATRPITLTTAPAVMTRALETFARAGLNYGEQCHAANTLAGMILGLALQYIGAPHMEPAPEDAPAHMSASPISMMATPEDAEQDFAFGLDLFITGLEHRPEFR